MARTLITVERLGSPTAAAFELAVNAALATFLNELIGAVNILVTDRVPNFVRQFKAIIDTESTGGTMITHPYKLKVFEEDIDASAKYAAETYMAANPGYFFAPVQYHYSDQISRESTRSLLFLFYNEDAADGNANWDPGYATSGGGPNPPTGPAGGDLSGTYPNPIVGPTTSGEVATNALIVGANVIGTQLLALAGDVEWEIELQKGATQYNTTVRANQGNGVTPEWLEDGVAISPAVGGTFDCPLTVAISGASITLVCTPLTVGWNARVRARILSPAP